MPSSDHPQIRRDTPLTILWLHRMLQGANGTHPELASAFAGELGACTAHMAVLSPSKFAHITPPPLLRLRTATENCDRSPSRNGYWTGTHRVKPPPSQSLTS